MARRTIWSIVEVDGEFVVLRGGRSIGFRPTTRVAAEKYIREHLAGGNKAQFFELDGYARTLPLRPR